MSALAARRAAAAASAVSVASSSSNTENSRPTKATPKTSNADVKRRSGKQLSTPVKHPPSLSGPESDSDAISATVSSKRRKVETSAPGQQRYFASQNTSVPEPDTARAKGKGRVRAFSPSIPVAESASEEYDGNDSSAVGSEVEIDEEEDAAVLVDEGRFRWATSGASTPLPSRSYQATAASQKVVDDGGNTRSKFTPKVGVNQYSVSEAMLRSIGLDGDGPGVVVSLAEGENLMITGIYTILPIQGIVSIFSTQISPLSTSKPIEVYATTSHPIPIIEPATSPSDVPIQSPFLQQLHLPWSYLIGSEQTICLIRENKCGLETIRAGAVPGFTNMLPEGSDNWGLKNFKPVFDSFPMLTYPYATSLSWSHSLNSLRHARNVDEQAYRPPTVVLVKGPKRSGKSTLARAALNTLLERYERVAWLECDLGQGEFTCGGAVGLWVLDSPVLGPSFTHPRIPHRAHFLGAYTPLACPDEYIAAIRHLTTEYTYNVQYPSVDLSASGMLYPSSQSDKITDVVPLVINTQGWVKGLGEDLLRGIEHASQPTHIFDFEQPVPEGIVEQSMNGWTSSPPHQSARLPNSLGYEMAGTESYLATSTDMGLREVKTFKVEPAPVSPLQARYTASDMRSLSTITYFHSRISSSAESQPRLTTWDLSRPLACERPLEVDLCADGPLRQVYIIGEGSNGVTKQDLVLSLNGSIVALVQIGDVRREEVYVQGRASPDLDKINLLGYAVIRAIRPHPSIEDGFQLQLLTPLRDAALGRCNAIIKNGAMELPLSTLLDWRKQPGDSSEEGVFGRRWEDGVPFLASGEAHGVGVERRRIRRNIMRKGM